MRDEIFRTIAETHADEEQCYEEELCNTTCPANVDICCKTLDVPSKEIAHRITIEVLIDVRPDYSYHVDRTVQRVDNVQKLLLHT